MKVLIVNLTRFGDLLQSQPAISAYAKAGDEVGIVCLENFHSVLNLLNNVSCSFKLPGAKALSRLDVNWREGVKVIDEFCRNIEETFNPDVIVNLTPSLSARLLCLRLSKGREVKGFALDQHGFNADSSSWASFLQLASASRGSSPFNVVDLFSRVAECPKLEKFALAEVEESIKEHIKSVLNLDCNGYVAFQLGASEDRRRWPIEYFVAVGQLLWKLNKKVPVLLGTESEEKLAEAFATQATFPFYNLVGKTSLQELSGVLSIVDALVTNDTGTMHLAAGLGVKICSIFLATAQPWDTGAALLGTLSFEPDLKCHPCEFGARCEHDLRCRRVISPEVIYEGVMSLINNSSNQFEGKNVRAYQTIYDSMGFLSLESLSEHGESDQFKFTKIQREIYRRFLDGEDLSSFNLNGEYSYAFSEKFCSKIVKSLSQTYDLLFLSSKQLLLLEANPSHNLKVKFLSNIQVIKDILDDVDELRVLSSLFRIEAESNDDIESLKLFLQKYIILVDTLKKCFEENGM